MIKQEVSEFLTWIRSVENEEERKKRRNKFDRWFYELSETEKAEAKATLNEDMEKLKDKLKVIRDEAEMVMKGLHKADS